MKLNNKTNGCGACDGVWKFLKPPHHKFFVKECEEHDHAYNIGGSKADRKKADRTLFNQMTKSSLIHFKERKTSSLYWFITLSFIYYKAVRIFGKKQFNHILEKST